MHITVAICTWNRCVLLDETLRRMQQLNIPNGVSWDLLIIDNNCTDATGAVIDQHRDLLPIQRFVEEKQGHSHARNRAIEECESDWLIYTDDDVLVSPDWLANYLEAISKASEYCGILGGPIEAWFEIEPSAELVIGIPSVGTGFCGISVPTDLVISRYSESLPFGANFAIRKSLVQGLRFDTNLGLKKGSRVVGEEIEFMRRLLKNGIEGKWVPNATVKHWIPRQRISLRYLAKHIYGAGRTSAKLRFREAKNSKEDKQFVPMWMYRRLFESLCLMVWNKSFGKKVLFYRNFEIVFHHFGFIRESFFINKLSN